MTNTDIIKKDFLVEIGTAELPPKALPELAQAFCSNIQTSLAVSRLEHGDVQLYATPRRIAVLIKNLSTKQTDEQVERRGPPIKVAYKDGEPSKAATKFAEANGVSLDDLERLETSKGEYLVYRGVESGKETKFLIPVIVQEALDKLPIPKRMRWGDTDASFVRPVYWVVMLLGIDIIDCEFFDIKSDRISRGHRFMANRSITIEQPSAYKNIMQHVGKVIVDFKERRDLIQEQTKDIANSVKGEALIDADLLNEVTALVELPSPILGDFDKRFLDLPREVLISTLQEHQKYFPVVKSDGELLPHFITISNIESKEPMQVKKGNERVIMPRLADAEFFWETDLKTPLEQRINHLDKVIFQKDLGSLGEKVQRTKKLAQFIAEKIGADVEQTERVASLAKCDLLTDMVGEFPDLQGIMGRHYATKQNENPVVANAIQEHYLPRFAGDSLPSSKVAQAVSLADRLDTITGIFSIGKIPTGTRDPFGLRRLSIGVLRILSEKELDLDLKELVTFSESLLPVQEKLADTVNDVMNYINERNKFYLTEQGYSHDQIAAVLATGSSNPLDLTERLEAVKEFITMPAAPNLAAANKRVSNILKKNAESLNELPPINVNSMSEKAEYALYQALQPLHGEISGLLNAHRYKDILVRLARLREPVDDFFENVMVMSDDDLERSNRLNLLRDFKTLSSSVADLSELAFE